MWVETVRKKQIGFANYCNCLKVDWGNHLQLRDINNLESRASKTGIFPKEQVFATN